MTRLPKRKAPDHCKNRNTDFGNPYLNAISQLTKIVNVAFRFHYFPETWKEANVIFTSKPSENTALPQDRWPISLLDGMGKVRKKNCIENSIEYYHATFLTNNSPSY
jgi:hypothetical protein